MDLDTDTDSDTDTDACRRPIDNLNSMTAFYKNKNV